MVKVVIIGVMGRDRIEENKMTRHEIIDFILVSFNAEIISDMTFFFSFQLSRRSYLSNYYKIY